MGHVYSFTYGYMGTYSLARPHLFLLPLRSFKFRPEIRSKKVAVRVVVVIMVVMVVMVVVTAVRWW